jgi:hypothetical protein
MNRTIPCKYQFLLQQPLWQPLKQKSTKFIIWILNQIEILDEIIPFEDQGRSYEYTTNDKLPCNQWRWHHQISSHFSKYRSHSVCWHVLEFHSQGLDNISWTGKSITSFNWKQWTWDSDWYVNENEIVETRIKHNGSSSVFDCVHEGRNVISFQFPICDLLTTSTEFELHSLD